MFSLEKVELKCSWEFDPATSKCHRIVENEFAVGGRNIVNKIVFQSPTERNECGEMLEKKGWTHSKNMYFPGNSQVSNFRKNRCG